MIFTNIFRYINQDSKPLYFRFWSNCILIKGYSKSILYDMFRCRSVNVSSFFYNCYERYANIPVRDIAGDYSFMERRGYLKMIDYFIKNDFGILVDDVDTLPPISMEYDTPYLATNVIVETNSDIYFNRLIQILNILSYEKIQALQINDYGHLSLQQFQQISESLRSSSIEAVHIYSRYSESYTQKQLSFMHDNRRLRQITLMESPIDKKMDDDSFVQGTVLFVRNVIDYSNCGNIGKKYFVTAQPFIIEAHTCNTCLNRKVCINIDGEVKNCPLMSESYGNIFQQPIRVIVEKDDFKKKWYLNKTMIDVCKDCEYRYFCTDCRHFVKDKKNIYSQPAKCNYNPYIAKWSDEDGYISVEESLAQINSYYQ